GLADVGFHTNETVFTLTELPRRLAVIGAGPIGCELAQSFARVGAQVVVLGNHPQIQPKEDRDAAKRVEASLRRDGVELVLGCKIVGASKTAEGKAIQLDGVCTPNPVVVDEIVVGAGRAPNVTGLGLEAAGVRYDPRNGVQVDDYLRTTNKDVFAAGDCCSKYQFTHAADAMARIVLRNALFFGRSKVTDLTMPWCTYTHPEIARIGLSVEEAAAKGMATRVFTQELNRVDRAILEGESDGFVKIVLDAKKDRILGATIVAANAGDMISEIAVAMAAKAGLGVVATAIHPYPTQAEAIKKAADSYNRTKLTPFVQGLFRRLLAWRLG
ncbi:MAG: FAD-dependent oxidoreductase, partial [Planctomycetia bacterium]